MSYEILTTIVAINAFVTLVLWRQVNKKINRPLGPNKKGAKALWHSDPIVPKHDPPKEAGVSVPSLVDDADRFFFEDFREFVDVLNWWLADKHIGSSFRLQELPDDDMSLNVDFESGPTFGRCFALYYNQMKIGRIEIHPVSSYTTENPEVNTSVKITWSRLLHFYEIIEFFGAIAAHLTTREKGRDNSFAVERSVQFAMTETLWDEYRISEYDRQLGDYEDWGELEVNFQGVAEFYMQRKIADAFR